MIPFNKAVYFEEMEKHITKVLKSGKIAGNGEYSKLCSQWMEERFKIPRVLLTSSCTSALEMCAILLDVKSGDEVIMPSYTFVSTANAFVLRGAKIVFVDIRPDTMNIDEEKIEAAITKKTKAIVIVHYAGVSCAMETIMDIANKYHLPVVEDAAQGVMALYKGRPLGTFGTLGCYSFHETKNYTMGEGGALAINDENFIERAEIIWEKGTNRARFFRGMVDKYSWVDIGSSYLPSEINASILYGQLERADEINDYRLKTWKMYLEGLAGTKVELPQIQADCRHNAHMFYIKVKDLSQRQRIISYLREHGVGAVFHYVPLHSSEGGKKYGYFSGEDCYTTKESERLIRLPIWYGIKGKEIETVLFHLKNVLLQEDKGIL